MKNMTGPAIPGTKSVEQQAEERAERREKLIGEILPLIDRVEELASRNRCDSNYARGALLTARTKLEQAVTFTVRNAMGTLNKPVEVEAVLRAVGLDELPSNQAKELIRRFGRDPSKGGAAGRNSEARP